MKTSMGGVVSAAILLVLATVGFGIAQAGGGNHTDGPVLSFKDQEALEQGDSSRHYVRVLPSGIDLDYDADGNPTQGMAQARGVVETGSLPGGSNADSSIVEIERDKYREGGDIGP